MPAIDSMAVAAMAMPYSPPSAWAPQIAAHTATTGEAVDFVDTPRPALMLVPWPVVDACATCRTGPCSVPGEYSVHHTITPGSARPNRAQPNRMLARTGESPISEVVTGQNAIAASTPETITPLYSAPMIEPPAFVRTKNAPMIEATIDTPPSTSGYSTALAPTWSSISPPRSMVAITVTA